jgi:hypothetical protein
VPRHSHFDVDRHSVYLRLAVSIDINIMSMAVSKLTHRTKPDVRIACLSNLCLSFSTRYVNNSLEETYGAITRFDRRLTLSDVDNSCAAVATSTFYH